MDEPTGRGITNLPPRGGVSDRLDIDAQMLWDLMQRGFEVDGEAVLCERMTWVIYGRTTYDGELILAEYANPDDAAAVIRSVVQRQVGARPPESGGSGHPTPDP